MLIEGAWTYRMQARVSRKLHDRLEAAAAEPSATSPGRRRSGSAPAIAGLLRRGKPKVVVTTAIAREMVGFIWAIARQVQLQPRA